MSMIPLLVNSDSVPREARERLADLMRAPPEEREAARFEAARALFRSTDLQCSEVRDLMGLAADDTGC